MDVSFSVKDRTLVVNLSGDIDHHSCEYIRQKTDKEFIERRLADMELDMSGVTFMDSSAIGFIVGRIKLVKGFGGNVCVTGVKRNFYKMIKLSGIDKIISINYEESEANG